MVQYKLLGELLLDEKLISDQDLTKCLEKQKRSQRPLGEILIEEGVIKEEQLQKMLAKQLELDYVDVRQIHISDYVLKVINEELARRYHVLPIQLRQNTLTVAVADPFNMSIIDDLFLLTNYEIKVVVASKKDIEWAIDRYYVPQEDIKQMSSIEESQREQELINEQLNDSEEDAPTISLVQSFINKAMAMKASDIHIEPHEHETYVRYRIDGHLHDIMTIPNHLESAVVSRLKIMARLHITEKRKPQDGGFHINVDGRSLDIRMSTMPTLFGEKVVLRLLEKDNILQIDDLGFQPKNLKKLRRLVAMPHGIILATGPTGSGKTTTLYAMLNELNSLEKNIVTIEDPIEYVLPRVNQTQVNPKAGFTFASGLRSFLRQDPDIIMVGEIRDEETAKIAVQAALTGHLVLSTLHTNTAHGTIYRLLNMGVEPYLIASSLKGVIANRLVRKICKECKKEVEVEPHIWGSIEATRKINMPKKLYKGEGCFKCQYTGYRGRIGLQEIMLVEDEELTSFLTKHPSEQEIKQMLQQKDSYITLADDGIQKAIDGITTLDEVIRVVNY